MALDSANNRLFTGTVDIIKVYQLGEGGLPQERTVQHVLGAPSTYTRGRNTAAITTQARGARFGEFAYDDRQQLLFVSDYTEFAWQPHGRVMVFDVHPDRIATGADAVAVLGQQNFTEHTVGRIGPQNMGSIDEEALDKKNRRLFITDRANNRIMVWDTDAARLKGAPAAMAVIGQRDFMSKDAGGGSDKFNAPGALFYDENTDRLFVADRGNNRILVFDVSPGKLTNGMSAVEVIGQPDFESSAAGIAADRFDSPTQMVYDAVFDRMLVVDEGNNRLLFFNASPATFVTGARATNVLGQDDFTSKNIRTNPKKWAEGSDGLVLDPVHNRLLANEGDRMLVFDIHPDRMGNNPDATNLVFSEEWPDRVGVVEGLATVTRTKATSVKVPIYDPDNKLLYVAASYMGRNAISIWNLDPKTMPETGLPATDVLGQYDWEGHVDFESRAANGRASGRWFYPRGTVLDPLDNRLFVNDQYMHRVLMFELDDENRPLDMEADLVLGQPDFYTSKHIIDASERDLNIPLALGYDPVAKHLYVADGGNNRIMVFDADPERLDTYDEAFAVIGQNSFTGRERLLGANGINLGVALGRGITSTAPLPMGFSVDAEGRRLFLSDGINHRVLIYDISNAPTTGMEAVGVIGQADFMSSDPHTSAKGFNVPSGLDYDPDSGRLFVVDGMNHRVLVFDATKGRIGPNSQAIAVLGQTDMTTTDSVRLDTTVVTEDVGRRRMRMPSGVIYDRKERQLYVNDKGNDRILVFDAAPGQLVTGQVAHTVIGQPDFTTRIAGDGEQEQLHDPRQLTFDSENGRLYVSDSFWGRLMMFDMPRTEKLVHVPAHGTKTYSTLDAWNGRPQPEDPRWGQPDEDVRQEWHSVVQSEALLPGAAVTYFNTEQVMDPGSLRRSRVLISETSVVPSAASSQAHFAVSDDENVSNRIVVTNDGTGTANIRFNTNSSKAARSQGRQVAGQTREIKAGERLEASVDELFGASLAGDSVLTLASDRPVSAVLLDEMRTSRNETLVMAVPQSVAGEGSLATIPGLASGGAYSTEIVLVNPTEEAISGEIAFRGRDGRPFDMGGGETIPFDIEPGGAFRWQSEPGGRLSEEGYAVVTGAVLPAGHAVVSVADDDLVLSRRAVPMRPLVHRAWLPVNTEPQLIRHGETRMALDISNPSAKPAMIRFTLFGERGEEIARREQLLPPGRHKDWSLGDLFNIQKAEGMVRLWSDVPISVSGTVRTETIRGETVESHVPYLTEDQMTATGTAGLPIIIDGEGVATQVQFINRSVEPVDATWRFRSSDGEPKEIVLR